MAFRPCLGCGRPSTTTRCGGCKLARHRKLYADHPQLRADWQPLIDAGLVQCCYCQETLPPGPQWDLAHQGPKPRHPAHQRCNRQDVRR